MKVYCREQQKEDEQRVVAGGGGAPATGYRVMQRHAVLAVVAQPSQGDAGALGSSQTPQAATRSARMPHTMKLGDMGVPDDEIMRMLMDGEQSSSSSPTERCASTQGRREARVLSATRSSWARSPSRRGELLNRFGRAAGALDTRAIPYARGDLDKLGA